MLNRIQSIIAMSLLTVSVVRAAEKEPPKRPNILWLIAEDLSPDLGCYGTPVVQTPNIDALAKQGVRFTQAIYSSSVCSVSRSAMHTGMYQTSIGAQNHRTMPKLPLQAGVKALPAYFREAGYFVCNGRAAFDPDDPNWSFPKGGKTDWNFTVDRESMFHGRDWSQRKAGQPFFAEVNFPEAHREWTPDLKRPIDPATVRLPPYYPDHPLVRLDWTSYLEEIQTLDDKVGAVLKRLEDQGLADNTIVFFSGDNGRPFCHGKIFLYEGGVHSPLIIRYPDGRGAGTVDDRLISMIDILPTTMEMCGIPIPSNMEGKSFADSSAPIHDVVFGAKDRVGVTSDRTRMVRSKRYKYLRNYNPERPYLPGNLYSLFVQPSLAALLMMGERGELNDAQKPFTAKQKPVEELYDLKNDPYELHNLAGDPEQKKRLITFRKQLEQWIVDSGDQGAVPEDPASIAPYGREIAGMKERRIARYHIDAATGPNMYNYWMKLYGLSEPESSSK